MTENETNMSIKHAVCVLEAIGNGLTLSNKNDREDACVFAIQAIEEIQQYRAIGTIEEFKALKEKNVAKKPHSISIANDIGNSMVECPICHARSDYDVKSIKRGYCWKCGQKLDWSE